MYQLKDDFQHYFPEGSIGPGSGDYAGQCAVFAEALINIGTVGDTIETKTAAVMARGIPSAKLAGNFLVGDVLILTTHAKAGHVAVINSILNGQLCLSESNFHLDKIVHHTRQISATDPNIVGVLRGNLKLKMPTPMKIIKIKLVANHSDWQSFPDKIAQIKSLLLEASAGRLDCQVDIEHTAYVSIPFINIGGVPTVEPAWFDQNITSRGKGYDIVCFQMATADSPLSGVNGYRGDNNEGPVETEIKSDENETTSGTDIHGNPNPAGWNTFVNTFLHENFGHALRLMTGQLDLRPDGSFLVHDYLDNAHGAKFDLTGLLNILDYEKLLHDPVNPYFYIVSQVNGQPTFSPGQWAAFSPEVQAAIKFNDTGGKNIIVNGAITSRDPRFVYP